MRAVLLGLMPDFLRAYPGMTPATFWALRQDEMMVLRERMYG